MVQLIKQTGYLIWRVTRRLPFLLGLLVVIGIAGGSERAVSLLSTLVPILVLEVIVRAALFVFLHPVSTALNTGGTLFTRYARTQPVAIAVLGVGVSIWLGIWSHQPLAVVVFGTVYAAAYPILFAHLLGVDAFARFRRSGTEAPTSPNIAAVETALLRILGSFYAPERDFKTEDGSIDITARNAEVMRHVTSVVEKDDSVVEFNIRNDTPGKTDADLVKVMESLPNVVGAYELEDTTPNPSPKGYKSFAVYFQQKYDATLEAWGLPNDLEATPDCVYVGVLADRSLASTSINTEHLFVVGASGSGKSKAALTQRIGIARQKHIAMVGIDPKLMELGHWNDRFSHISYADCCVPVILDSIWEEIQRRKRFFREHKIEKLTPDMWEQIPMINIDIDEAAEVFDSEEGEDVSKHNRTRMVKIAAQGRALGIQLTMATQRPDAETIPKKLMTNISQKMMFRTADPAETKMAARTVSLTELNPAHDIPIGAKHKGTGYLISDTFPKGVKMKAFLALDNRKRAAILADPNATDADKRMAENRTIEEWVAFTAPNRVTLPWLDDDMNQHFKEAHRDLYDPAVPSFYLPTQQPSTEGILNLSKH